MGFIEAGSVYLMILHACYEHKTTRPFILGFGQFEAFQKRYFEYFYENLYYYPLKMTKIG